MGDRLEGRAAIVTGASRGLGRAIALAMAAEGAKVAVVARTQRVWNERLPGTIGETVAAIEEAGGTAVAVRADLLAAGDVQRLYEEAEAAVGPIDILVNNAAFTAPGRPPADGAAPSVTPPAAPRAASAARADWPGFVGTPLGAFRRHFEINVFATYELMQLAAAGMIQRGGGAIVNVTSGASRLPGPGPYPDREGGTLPGYGGSKAAMEHLTSCAAFDLQAYGIPVNALSPSVAIMTPGVAYYSHDFDEYGSELDFAEAAIRLALVDAGEITGRTIGHFEVLDGSFRSYTG
jgi:7-alpha-hydroxysteroid dehydrogenase